MGLTPNYPAKIVPIKFGVNVESGSSLIAQGGSIMTQLGDVGKFNIKLNFFSLCLSYHRLTPLSSCRLTDVGCDFDFNFLRCCCGGFGVCRQKLTGSDDSIAFLSAGGTIIYRQLNDGETIIVDSRSVLAYDQTVKLGLSLNGRLCTCCCGGEGTFIYS